MRYPGISKVSFALTVLSSLFSNGLAFEIVERDDSSGILINPPGFAPLPPLQAQAGAGGLNLTNIQSDILIGMRKNQELFFFFQIKSPNNFKSRFRSGVFPLITTTTQVLDVSTLGADGALVNVAFSHTGLSALGVPQLAPDTDAFALGQASLAVNILGDPPPISDHWVPAFTQPSNLHGVLIIASNTQDNISRQLQRILNVLGDSISEVYRLQGNARPGNEAGHEHFGFKDGISQPGIQGFTTNPVKGQRLIPPGIILVGEQGDESEFAAWGKDGSFLAFRQLKQLVPEFNKFLADNPVNASVPSREAGSELTGARMVGRWKSGAPIELTPLADNLTIADDPNLNNDFGFVLAGDNSRCPFSAHIRKTNPRTDLDPTLVDPRRIMRAGTPYGPEVTPQEAASNTTTIERGLAFVAYQSSITKGFNFVQHSWSNNANFSSHPPQTPPGFDPIIGANQGNPRNVSGLDIANQTRNLTILIDFIESRGGEYFFSPSLSAILDTITA